MHPEGKDPGGEALAKYFDAMNDPTLLNLETVLEMDEHQADVITFSHYLPRQELLPVPPRPAAMQKLRIVTLGFGTGRQKWPLNDGQIPNSNILRVALGTGHNRVEGNRRASRNDPVSDLPPEIPNVTIRNFSIAV
jgi:hypothetical protein